MMDDLVLSIAFQVIDVVAVIASYKDQNIDFLP